MNIFIRLIFAFLINSTLIISAQAETLAILPLDSAGQIDSEISDAVTSFVENSVVEFEKFRIVSRVQIKKLLNEQKFELTGITDNAVEAGKILSADYVVIGRITKLGKEFTLILHLIDVETAEIKESAKNSAQISLEDIDNILVDPTVEDLLVTDKSATDLILIVNSASFSNSVWGGILDPYPDPWFQVCLYSDSEHYRFFRRSHTKMNTFHPQYYERFHITDYHGEQIHITFYDHNDYNHSKIAWVEIDTPKSGKYDMYGFMHRYSDVVGNVEVEFK